ncbi:hypothetical protein [Micromonospora nigra]|uniref:hypothetical protein n=1 Tax=Micromonospora nigra TaxID=145857 RepID=UPI001FE2277E|nr:hypothetical protein [Micromonospora nigra]
MSTEPLRCAGALIVDGDLTRPRLEAGKHTEFRWLAADEIALLDEHRHVNDGLMRRIAENAFAALRATGQ